MDPITGAVLATAIATGANAWLGYEGNKQAWNQSMDAWNKQNEYNKPINQMARLKEAGLNPNLAYGSGNVGGITTSGAPQMSAPNLKIDPIAKYYEIKNASLTSQQLKSQIDQIKASTREANARANQVDETTKGIAYDNALNIGAGVSPKDTAPAKLFMRLIHSVAGGDAGKYMAGTGADLGYAAGKAGAYLQDKAKQITLPVVPSTFDKYGRYGRQYVR